MLQPSKFRELAREAQSQILVGKPVPRPDSSPSSSDKGGFDLYDSPVYKHSSSFATPDLELVVRSPHVELVVRPGDDNTAKGKVPVFGIRDSIGGTVFLNPNTCPPSSRAQLVISIEGALIFSRPAPVRLRGAGATLSTTQRHVFLFSSTTIPLGEIAEREKRAQPSALLGRSIRASIRRTIQRGQSKFGKDYSARSHSMTDVTSGKDENRPSRTFLFHLPLQHEKELPPSFKTEQDDDDEDHVKVSGLPVDDPRVEYTITARWESGWLEAMRSQVVGEFMFEPGSSSMSFYALPSPPLEWSETPLKCPRWERLPFRCMLTLPDPRTFARDSDSTFFVGFSTVPPSRTLTAELQAKAEISVALSCQYWFDSSQEVATNATGKTTKWKQPPASPLMRIVSSARTGGSKFSGSKSAGPADGSGLLNRSNSVVGPLPLQDLIETRQLWAENKRGFPNRPRRKPAPAGLDTKLAPLGPGPHGLWKHQIQFGQDLMPSMDIPGMTVKYFMSAIVRFEGYELKTDVELKIVEPHIVRPLRPPRGTAKFNIGGASVDNFTSFHLDGRI